MKIKIQQIKMFTTELEHLGSLTSPEASSRNRTELQLVIDIQIWVRSFRTPGKEELPPTPGQMSEEEGTFPNSLGEVTVTWWPHEQTE